MITLRDACCSYRKNEAALRDISCELHAGIHLLMGANGAGKTTLMHLMAGLRYPSSGECLLDGRSLRLRLPSQLEKIQYFSPEMDFPEATVEKMVERHGPFFPRFDPDLLARILEIFGISTRSRLASMSYGSAVKARIAYMLALKCDVLLLDEPTAGLDVVGREQFGRVLMEAVDESQTVVVSTHALDEFNPIYDSVMFMRDGRLLLHTTLERIARRVAFVVAPGVPSDVIYWERVMGRCHCIVPALDTTLETTPDCALLYKALSSPSSRQLLDILKDSRS